MDVLAVMRAASSNARLGVDLHLTADAIDAARANVADLIMEADGLLHFLDGHPAYRGGGPITEQLLNFRDGLTAALARVQGGAR